MADRFDIKVGDRITYTDPHGIEEAFSGRVDTIMLDGDSNPAVVIVECDDGRWATLDLRIVTIQPAAEAHN